MHLKYVVTLEYYKFPELQFTTTATSDEKAIENVIKEAIKEYPQLKDKELLRTNVSKSQDPYS